MLAPYLDSTLCNTFLVSRYIYASTRSVLEDKGGLGEWHVSFYTVIGSIKGKTPEHNQAKQTKHPHSLEWNNSTITIVFPSTHWVSGMYMSCQACKNSFTGHGGKSHHNVTAQVVVENLASRADSRPCLLCAVVFCITVLWCAEDPLLLLPESVSAQFCVTLGWLPFVVVAMKKFDVVVFGSTGFTGRLVCKHIAQTYHGKVRHSADGLGEAHGCLSIAQTTHNIVKHQQCAYHVSYAESCYACCLKVLNRAPETAVAS